MQENSVGLGPENRSTFRLAQKEAWVKHDGGERPEGGALALKPKRVVNQGLPSWRNRCRQPHTPFRVRAVEPRVTESRRQCNFECLLQRFRREVNVPPKLHEVFGVLFTVAFVYIVWNDRAPFRLLDIVIQM